MEQKETPGFYAVIPATVRYDKNVCSGAKLLYGELTALTKKEGYCYASNKYFADLYGVDAGTISRWVSKLRECGYISVEVTDRVHRKIWILENKVPQKSAEDTQKKASGATKTPIQDTQKRLDINTDIITNNNKEREESAPAKFKEVIKAKDPLFPDCQMSDGEMVMNVIQEFLDEHWNRMAVDRHSLRDCQDIFDKLREEDKVAQLKRCLILHTYGTIDGQKKTFWSKTPPQPKFLKLNWNDIYSAKIPLWFEKGFTSQLEYETHLSATRPESHSSMRELKDQFFSGPSMSKEQADDFMNQLDELKEELNGKT